MDSYIKWPYPIADHYCRITWVYNKNVYQIPKSDDFGKHIRKGPPKKKLKCNATRFFHKSWNNALNDGYKFHRFAISSASHSKYHYEFIIGPACIHVQLL